MSAIAADSDGTVAAPTAAERWSAVVDVSTIAANQPLPLMVAAKSTDLDLAAWLRSQAKAVESRLLRHGAVLFRGFAVHSASDFQRAAETICPDLHGDYGDLPRQANADKVYDSTPYPADQSILFHHEASHTGQWPLKQWFYCATPAQQGGRTPLADGRVVLRALEPEVRDEFARKRLTYVRNFTPGLDVSWQNFFKVADRAAAEQECRRQGFSCAWKRNEQLQIRRTCDAILRHPKTGEAVFFNQIQLHHISCLAARTRESLLALFGDEDLPRNVLFGDGSVIPDALVDCVRAAYREATAGFDWSQGDVLLVDNVLAAHGRDPFVGPRKILVAMGEMMRPAPASSH